MTSPEVPKTGPAHYRADFYLFRHFLMGMGAFRDKGVTSHQAMKLVFGVNRPFRIRLEDRWTEARAALISGGTPHFLNGEDDWQIVLWIEPHSSLGILLEARTLEGRPWSLQGGGDGLSMDEVIQTAGDIPDPSGALELAETLLHIYGGIKPVNAAWDNEIRSVLSMIENDPGGLTVAAIARHVGRPEAELAADFRRVVGSDLDGYLHRRKLTSYIGLRQEGCKREEALRNSGLPGWSGLKDGFTARYGLDLEILEHQSPFVRVYRGREDQAVLYL